MTLAENYIMINDTNSYLISGKFFDGISRRHCPVSLIIQRSEKYMNLQFMKGVCMPDDLKVVFEVPSSDALVKPLSDEIVSTMRYYFIIAYTLTILYGLVIHK